MKTLPTSIFFFLFLTINPFKSGVQGPTREDESSGAGLGSATCNIPQPLVTLQPCRYLYMIFLYLSSSSSVSFFPLLCFLIFSKLNKCLIDFLAALNGSKSFCCFAQPALSLAPFFIFILILGDDCVT